MHTHIRPSAEALGVAANGINNAGRQGVSFAAWAVPAQPNDERNQANTDNGTLALYGLPSPWHPSACKRDFFSLSHTRVEAQTELSAKETCKLPTGYAT